MTKESRRVHNPVIGSTDGALEKAGLLAPPEELSDKRGRAGSNNGSLTEVNTAELKLSGDLTEADEKRYAILGLEPVAFVILVLALGFIAFITYLISTEPPDTKGDTNTTIEIQR